MYNPRKLDWPPGTNTPPRGPHVYVLELEDGCYYIGYTERVYQRLQAHFANRAASWTKLHRPIRLLALYPADQAEERRLTIEYMATYGWEKVRGSIWIIVDPQYFKHPLPNLKD